MSQICHELAKWNKVYFLTVTELCVVSSKKINIYSKIGKKLLLLLPSCVPFGQNFIFCKTSLILGLILVLNKANNIV